MYRTRSEVRPPVEASAGLHERVQRRRILAPSDDEQLDVPFEFEVGDGTHNGARRHRHVFGRQHDAETRAHEVMQTLPAMTGSVGVAVRKVGLSEGPGDLAIGGFEPSGRAEILEQSFRIFGETRPAFSPQ